MDSPRETPAFAGGSGALDVTAVARGSFRGFLVLMVGTLFFPLVAREFAGITPIWLSMVSVAGFAFAACHQGQARLPIRQGIAAAAGAFALVLPILLFSPAVREPGPMALTAATALVVGATVGAGFVVTRRVRATRGVGQADEAWRKR